MKQITETKFVEQTFIRYLADDGREFKTKEDCEGYEKMLYEKRCKKLFDEVKHRELELPLLDWACEATGYIVRMNDADDYRATVDYFESVTGWGLDVDISEPLHYPCTKIVIVQWGCGAYEYCNTVDSLVNRYHKAIEEITNF